MNTQGVILPPGLCICCVLCLEPSSPGYLHGSHLHLCRLFSFHLLSDACPYLLSLFFIVGLSSGMLNNLLRMSIVCLPRFFSLLIPDSLALLGDWHTSWD